MTCERFREQFFGRQLVDSGAERFYDQSGRDYGSFAVFFPTNPFAFISELGFMGSRYLTDFAPVMPEYFRPGYGGILPLGEQPKIDMPLAYREPVLF